jgi:hypothetical protein
MNPLKPSPLYSLRPIHAAPAAVHPEDSSEEEQDTAHSLFASLIAGDPSHVCSLTVSTLNPYSDRMEKIRSNWQLSLSESVVRGGFFFGVFNLLEGNVAFFRPDRLPDLSSRIKIKLNDGNEGDSLLVSESRWRSQPADQYLSQSGRILLSVRGITPEDSARLYEKVHPEESFETASGDRMEEIMKTYAINTITYRYPLPAIEDEV